MNVSPSSDEDLTASLVHIPILNYEVNGEIDIHDTSINNSVISLIKADSVPFSETEKKITYQNISYMNSVIPSDREIITTYGFFSGANLKFTLDQLHFGNISCPKQASLLGFQHKLSDVFSFNNIESADILEMLVKYL